MGDAMGSIDSFLLTRDAHAPQIPHPLSRPRPRTWTEAEVVALMDTLSPRVARGVAERQRLSTAFLAGVAQAQVALLQSPQRSLVELSIETARTLLKNRAATPESRLWHAFLAGTRAAAPAARPLRLFIRQPLTESGQAQQDLIAAVLARIDEHNGDPCPFRYLTGRQAESAETFRASFEAESGLPFTPQNFRTWRLDLLSQAEAFINIRVGMSESSAFELSYHVFKGACTPVLFLVWKHAPIKTTLLKDLEHLCDVTYVEFDDADDIRDNVGAFFRRLTH